MSTIQKLISEIFFDNLLILFRALKRVDAPERRSSVLNGLFDKILQASTKALRQGTAAGLLFQSKLLWYPAGEALRHN